MASVYILLLFLENDDQAEKTAAELFDHPVVRKHLVATLGMDATVALSLTDTTGWLTMQGFETAAREAQTTGGWRGNGPLLSFSIQEMAEMAHVDKRLADLPAVFIHFLTRRLKANQTRHLIANDEVDWAMRHGEDELLWTEVPPDDPYFLKQILVLPSSCQHRSRSNGSSRQCD